MQKVRIGLLGLGQVGSGVYRILNEKKLLIERQIGKSIVIPKILVKNPDEKQLVATPRKLLTKNPLEVLRDPTISVIVEVAGGIRPTEGWYYEAFKNGKDIVTANKALLAEKGDKLFAAANKYGRQIFYEASVAGGIPIIKTLREGLIANRIESFAGIVNGTSNYILTQMSQKHMGFEEALRLAQREGYAEKDPTLDVKGIDAAHKLVILIRLGFGRSIVFSELKVRGIDTISHLDIEYAKRFGLVIKLIAQAKESSQGLFARVEPLLLKEDHILAKVDGAFNAILLRGDEVGDLLLYGRGAGTRPTASAVVNDLHDLLKGRLSCFPHGVRRSASNIPKGPICRYYLRFSVVDQPGVLSRISKCLGEKGVSIAEVIQLERKVGNIVPLIMVTHHSSEESIEQAVSVIDKLACVRSRSQRIRIEE